MSTNELIGWVEKEEIEIIMTRLLKCSDGWWLGLITGGLIGMGKKKNEKGEREEGFYVMNQTRGK